MNTCTCEVVAPESVEIESGLEALGIPGGGYFEGQWIKDGCGHAVTDPEDDSVVAHVHVAGFAEMDRAISSVEKSLTEGEWPLWERRDTLERAAALVKEESTRLARIISAESSKTITDATREVARTAETLRLSSASAHLIEGETLALADTPRGADRFGWNRRTPLGIIAAITPFNDPMNLVAHKIGPALLAGNAVVLKPAKATPLSAFALLDVLLRSGLPAERMAVLVSDREAGTALVSDARIAAVSFTGGPATGDKLARAAGARKIMMELGGNNAVLVCEDGNVDAAAQGIVDGAFGVAGQNCLSVQRVYVHESRYDELLAKVVKGTSRLSVGSKREASTDVGPLITEQEAQRVASWVDEAVADGAQIAIGGTRTGSFYEPTVLTDVPKPARVLHEEIFGPVVSILPFRDLDDALADIDNTEYGLQAGVFTESMATAMRAVDRLHVGSVLINDTSDFRIDSMPFGGSKRSGIGREGVATAVLEMSEPKNVIMNLG